MYIYYLHISLLVTYFGKTYFSRLFLDFRQQRLTLTYHKAIFVANQYSARRAQPATLSPPTQPPLVVTMVQMMESQCEYYMYFPAVPITDLSDPARYRTLPRRSHLYLGETVRFLLVLRCRDGAATPTDYSPGKAWGGERRVRRIQTSPAPRQRTRKHRPLFIITEFVLK